LKEGVPRDERLGEVFPFPGSVRRHLPAHRSDQQAWGFGERRCPFAHVAFKALILDAIPGRATAACWAGGGGRQARSRFGHSGGRMSQDGALENVAHKNWGSDKGVGLPFILGVFLVMGSAAANHPELHPALAAKSASDFSAIFPLLWRQCPSIIGPIRKRAFR